MKKLVVTLVFISSAVFSTNSRNSLYNSVETFSSPLNQKVRFIRVTPNLVLKKVKQKDIYKKSEKNAAVNKSNSFAQRNKSVKSGFENTNHFLLATQQNAYKPLCVQNCLYNINPIYNGVQSQWHQCYYDQSCGIRNPQFIPACRKNVEKENEDLYKYVDKKYEEADRKIEEVKIESYRMLDMYENELTAKNTEINAKNAEIKNLKEKYRTAIEEKEQYKKEVNRLNRLFMQIQKTVKQAGQQF